MPDPRFFKNSGNLTVGILAERLGCQLAKDADHDYELSDVAPLNTAGPYDLSFLDNIKYKSDFAETKAGACFVLPQLASLAPKGVICLVTNSPYKTYARAAQIFYPAESPCVPAKIAPSAIISPTAQIGAGCTIEANVVIEDGAVIGEGTWIEAGAIIHHNSIIGSNSRIGANATISYAIIGDHTRIYTGARIGQDGFGFAIDPKGHVKVPQLGRVIIGNHVEIGANTTIDRGSGPDTVIGDGTWIDNMVQIAHNVVVGRGCVFASQVGISGSTKIGDFVAMGGQVGVAGHITIGTGARIGAKSGVVRDVPAGEEHMGYPAFPIKQYWRQVAVLNALIKRKKSD